MSERKMPASRTLLNITKAMLDHSEEECAQLRTANADLLEALRAYVAARLCDCSEHSGCLEAARQSKALAAIARATGEQAKE